MIDNIFLTNEIHKLKITEKHLKTTYEILLDDDPFMLQEKRERIDKIISLCEKIITRRNRMIYVEQDQQKNKE